MNDELLIGIDFGTSTIFVSKYDFEKKDAVQVENMGAYGRSNIFDNVIYIEGDKKYIIGETKRFLTDPLNYFHDIKRHVTNDNKRWRVPNLNNREVTAKDISEMVFFKIKEKIESNFGGKKISGAVITVPYAYSDKYRKRIKESAERAGIPVIQLVEEPVAAAISFGIFNDEVQNNKKENIVVFDLGGGTFDLTVFQFEKSDKQHAKIEVLNTGGHQELGGKDIDKLLSERFRKEFLQLEFSDITNDQERAEVQLGLLELANDTKEELTHSNDSDVFKSVTVNSQRTLIEKNFIRTEFEELLKRNNFIGKIEESLQTAIDESGLEVSEIDRVVLAGGSSAIPIIKRTIRDFFGFEPEAKKNLGELVGHGAGILAGLSKDKSLHYEIIRKTSKSVGISLGNKFQPILRKNSRYGEISSSYLINIENLKDADELVIYFYEGDSVKIDQCERIGKATIKTGEFSAQRVYLSLYRDEKSGELFFKFYKDNNKKEIIVSKKVESLD